MRCVQQGDQDYDEDRRISNARFHYYPRYICYCSDVADVQQALKKAKAEELAVRIRSGGHHHEGMCSGDGVLIVDLSEINHIDIATGGPPLISLGPGAKLGQVYDTVFARGLVFPGGGCGDVCVGGLVQGGGWGPYSRAMGLTCDRLIAFRMVKADGTVIDVTDKPDDPNRDLLWAVRGGGGGNFGVITEFRFRLDVVQSRPLSFTVTWSNPALRKDVVNEWRRNFPADGALELTSYCRLTIVEPNTKDTAALVGGGFLGPQTTLDQILARLLPTTYPKRDLPLTPLRPAAPAEGRHAVLQAEYQPGPPESALGGMAAIPPFPPGGLSDTCAGYPFPHKVSSCFPKTSFGDGEVDAIVNYLESSKPEGAARRYLSLHGFGGNVRSGPDKWSCFPYRDKPFMLQYQAWWADVLGNPGLGDRCQAWVKGFREAIKGQTEGSFINFPDKDLVAHPETPEGREELLKFYYADNLEKLITIKRTYDPFNVFDFEMGIPTRIC